MSSASLIIPLRATGHFIFVTFASAFLLKVQTHSTVLPFRDLRLTCHPQLLKPEFHSFLSKDQDEEIFTMITRLIQTLNSPEIAIDDRHTPRLHARFLAGLLSRHRRDVATSGRLHPSQPPPSQPLPVSGSPPLPSSSSSQSAGQQQQQGYTSSASQSPMQHGHQLMHGVPEAVAAPVPVPVAPEPVYQQEAAYTADIGPLEVLDFGSDGTMDDEIFGGALLALKNPNYWDNMMMPG